MASPRLLLATLVVLLAVLGAASAAREFSRDHEMLTAPAASVSAIGAFPPLFPSSSACLPSFALSASLPPLFLFRFAVSICFALSGLLFIRSFFANFSPPHSLCFLQCRHRPKRTTRARKVG